MLSDVVHQERDDHHRDQERHQHADAEDEQLIARESEAVLDDLEKAGAEHDRDRKDKRELGCHCTGDADHQASEDRGARAGRSGEDRCDQLEQADQEGILESQVAEPVDSRHFVFVDRFDNDE